MDQQSEPNELNRPLDQQPINKFSFGFKKVFEHEVASGFKRMSKYSGIISDADISHLPELIRNYLINRGVLGKEKAKSIFLKFGMKLRAKPNGKWMDIKVQQYSFFDIPTRLFYIKANMMGIPASGLHHYFNGKGTMKIKALSLIPIINASGNEMNISETVTFFNDMCIMAPATLIDKSIGWSVIDKFTVKGEFTVNGITISAHLIFNEQGQLVNFISYDRYCYMPDGSFQKFKFSTPVSNYREFNGISVPTYGEAIWEYPEGDFCYGKFDLKEMKYNL